MLRMLTLMLALANVLYFAWTEGLLASLNLEPATQTEPQRLEQQFRPGALRVSSPQESRQLGSTTAPIVEPAQAIEKPATSASSPAAPALPASSAAPALTTLTALPTLPTLPVSSAPSPAVSLAAAVRPKECLQAGPFDGAQTAALRTKLQSSLPDGSWAFENALEPGLWMVYMGKYSSQDAVTKKKSELRGLGVSFDALNNAALEPGLSLGRFDSKAAADADLVRIAKRGVRTAKVIALRAEVPGQVLKLAAVDADLRSKLEALKTQLPQLVGKALVACR